MKIQNGKSLIKWRNQKLKLIKRTLQTSKSLKWPISVLDCTDFYFLHQIQKLVIDQQFKSFVDETCVWRKYKI